MKVETRRIFGQNDIQIIESTYIQSVKRNKDNLEIEIAGPDYYDNIMTLENSEEEELLKAFQPPKIGDHEEVPDLEHIAGHSVHAYYQEARVIGFSVI